jgi:hypothetical protein
MFYYVFKFLAKLFLPILVKKAVEKAGENFQQQQQYAQQQYAQQQYEQQQYSQNNRRYNNQDEIIVDTARYKNPKETKKVGEYVDYEEID